MPGADGFIRLNATAAGFSAILIQFNDGNPKKHLYIYAQYSRS